MIKFSNTCAAVALLASAISISYANEEIKNPLRAEGSWSAIQEHITGEEKLVESHDMFRVDLPIRAEDAAIVPIRIVDKADDSPIRSMDIVIDENPMPLAAEFEFSPSMDPLDFETRVRINQYSNVRVIAQMGGEAIMDGRYVKASGGCSAPAGKDPAEALASIGKMKFKSIPVENSDRSEAQIMIQHPNYSGLQRDQVTQLFVPAQFVDQLDVYQGKEKLFSMKAGISISENPIFRFAYTDNGSKNLRVVATDTKGNQFEQIFDK